MTSPLQQKLKITGPSIVTANRTSDGVEKQRSRVQNMSKWPGLAVNVRPFQHASMQARITVAASPGWRVWPWRWRRARTRSVLR